jgi:hypothetical protein
MSKSSAPNAGDHWRKLAAELGLEMEPPPPAEPEPPPVPEPPPLPQREAPVEEFAAAADSGIWTADTHTLDALSIPEPPPHTEFPVTEFDRNEPSPEDVAAPADEGGESEKPRRRRRRSRRKKGDGAEVESVAPAEEPATAPASEEYDSPAELVKNWDIPSWNDLIASLYRPER